VLKRSNQYFAIVPKPGLTTLNVYAMMPYGKTKVGQKQYKVSDNPPVFAQFGNFTSGSTIESEKLATMAKLDLVSNVDLGAIDIVEFQFIHISKGYTAIAVPIKNFGSSLNYYIKRQLATATPGDVLLFNNVMIKSPSGKTTTLPTYSITVK
jgi:hypothetical protein